MDNFTRKNHEERSRDLMEQLQKVLNGINEGCEKKDEDLLTVAKSNDTFQFSMPLRHEKPMEPDEIMRQHKNYKEELKRVMRELATVEGEKERLCIVNLHLGIYEKLSKKLSEFQDLSSEEKLNNDEYIQKIKIDMVKIQEKIKNQGIMDREDYNRQNMYTKEKVNTYSQIIGNIGEKLKTLEDELIRTRIHCKSQLLSLDNAYNRQKENAEKEPDIKKEYARRKMEFKGKLIRINYIMDDINRSKDSNRLYEFDNGSNIDIAMSSKTIEHSEVREV